MKGYLEKHVEEVIETLMLQWDNELAMQARFEEGYEDGHNDAIEFVAINMLRSGMTVDKIKELTQLSSERIRELEKNTRS